MKSNCNLIFVSYRKFFLLTKSKIYKIPHFFSLLHFSLSKFHSHCFYAQCDTICDMRIWFRYTRGVNLHYKVFWLLNSKGDHLERFEQFMTHEIAHSCIWTESKGFFIHSTNSFETSTGIPLVNKRDRFYVSQTHTYTALLVSLFISSSRCFRTHNLCYVEYTANLLGCNTWCAYIANSIL